jgi:hypothetical protein
MIFCLKNIMDTGKFFFLLQIFLILRVFSTLCGYTKKPPETFDWFSEGFVHSTAKVNVEYKFETNSVKQVYYLPQRTQSSQRPKPGFVASSETSVNSVAHSVRGSK